MVLSESFLSCEDMTIVYLTTTTNQIKPYTICSSYQLGFEVKRPERSTTFSFLHDKRNMFSFKGFFQRPYTEPAALCMKFPTRGSSGFV